MAQEDVIAVRNALFEAGSGKSLNDVMLGTIMAQSRLIVETADDLDQARQLLAHFYTLAYQGLPEYWDKDRGRGAEATR